MSAYRVMKKTVYGAIYIVIAGLFIFLIISPLLPKGQNTVATPTPQPFTPIIVENIVAVPHIQDQGPTGKTVDVVARIRNTNPEAGIADFAVQFLLKDTSGATIQSVTQHEYVLPGGIEYVAALDMQVPPGATFDHAEVVPPANPTFTSVPATAPVPQFSVFLRDRTYIASGSFPFEQQTGIVTNSSSFDWQKVEVTAVALDTNGNIVGVGKTFVGKLIVGEQREFTLQWPRPSAATARVIAIATTDMFNDDNFVNIVGDPSKLR